MADATVTPKDARDYTGLLETKHCDAFTFSEQEQLALDLYDQLRELELQKSLLEAQSEDTPDFSALSDDEVQEQLALAEREAMEAKAEYELRHRITRNVLVMDPVLKAVHGDEATAYTEKRIHPLVTENDIISMVHGYLTSKLASTSHAVGVAEQRNMEAIAQNQALSKTLLELTTAMKVQSKDDIQDPQLRSKVDAVEKEAKEARRRMRNLKCILSAMIVGSGINWAEDGVFRELVMDDEDEG